MAGLERKHQLFSIAPEELIILTTALSEFDPRLRDEALDWCIHYHRYISPIRLQILAKQHKYYISGPFSKFSRTVNAMTKIRTKWVTLAEGIPFKIRPSGKSILRDFETPSMICFRLRSLLGTGAGSDVLAFLLSEQPSKFTTSDLLETGYSKRRLAGILKNFAEAGILSEFYVRNQLYYTFIKQDLLIKLLGGVPKNMVHWNRILTVLLPIHACLQETEDTPIGVRVVDMRNLLQKLASQLLQMNLTPPPLQNDFETYWSCVTKWILDFSKSLALGEF
ncbi:MAG: hypothetical protein V4489_06725 [Chlamydiota bacterium]